MDKKNETHYQVLIIDKEKQLPIDAKRYDNYKDALDVFHGCLTAYDGKYYRKQLIKETRELIIDINHD